MASNIALKDLFFKELKQYNTTNFKTLLNSDFSKEDAAVHKCCSSVVTRYFIFAEKHPEISDADMHLLYFQLRIDMIARYFSEYPASSLSDLQPFQDEMRRYVEKTKGDESVSRQDDTTIQYIELDTADSVPVEQLAMSAH